MRERPRARLGPRQPAPDPTTATAMRPTVPSSRGARRRLVWLAAAGALVLLLLLAWRLSGPSAPDAPTPAPILSDGDQAPAPARPAGPPWHHGAANARFTLVLYADLECPHCKTYFPEVLAWIEQHPDTRLQWHHLPLPAHEPAASRLASLAECAGDDHADQLRTLHALVVCSLTTLLVFLLLALSSIPVLRAIGTTVALGVLCNFVLSLFVARHRAAIEAARAEPEPAA